MKILDRYILTTYLKTFLSVFVILLLIFVLQTIWLYIKELAGKDLDMIVVFKFLAYFMPKLIPLVIPLTILLSSIMVFGSFAENYEFAAMKSTGISLQRAMSGLSIFIVALGFTTFMFSNNVIPWAEYNSLNLRKNIAKLKPAMLLAAGQFNEVGDYNIKFASKSGDKGQYLNDVVIHIKGADKRTNAQMIKSISGELIGKETSNVLKLILTDGNYYNDIYRKNPKERKKQPFAKSTFEKYTINIDLSQINDNVDIDDKSYSDKYNMLNLSELNYTIDSLTEKRNKTHETLSKSLYQRTNITRLKNTSTTNKSKVKQKNDSVYSGEILDLFETKNKSQLLDLALRNTNSTKQIIESKQVEQKLAKSNYNKHIVSFHEKLALGFACIILFFVGAPLGALIRKGGIGLPMVIAIVLFLTYHFIGIFATNSAKSGDFNPILASWFSTLVMFPLGLFLTKRATEDKGLFEMDNIIEPLKKVFKIKPKGSINYKFLSKYSNEELINVVKHYETLGHSENTRYEAIKTLNARHVDVDELRKQGVSIHKTFDASKTMFNNYKAHSKFAIILYSIGVILLVLFFVFKNNKMPSLQSASIQLSAVALFLFIIYYSKSILNLNRFYYLINKKVKMPHIILLIIGVPLYMLVYPFLNVKINEDLKQNCLDSLK
ncbi:LptF/LptG family permease [Hwangdonia lutea]|uniref:LptF/LptG family permease n=1 Tax=Hwangdonia lutea TaxID=3075823 RepID=A0AA97HRR8_9FLAO|nr:LptF/LptG family permease [Hwangdonia sp. SCSIO 19198]WOD43773.1 LptF/LptG family permease [Hwangdonia sp. SCSIO 19198]